MTFRKWLLGIFAVSAAAVCVSLGIWQLRRMEERRQQNAFLASRRFAPEISLEQLPADPVEGRFRRVRLAGVYDHSNEIVHTLRGRRGSPGVNILTPLLRHGNDTAVLVNRGWVYAPDGMTVDTRPWRETDTLEGSGFVETFPAAGVSTSANPRRPRSFRRLDRSVLAELFPYPIANYYVVLTDSTSNRETELGRAPAPNIPPRVEPAALDEGPHRSYAVQWFSFAAISIIGLVIFLRRA
ncbi:MAG TPA: SURF1 family protein [Gemmatimonadaceae bacterium]|nr:SURF1 family protein [Gemmatimonadaceae bacterium]